MPQLTVTLSDKTDELVSSLAKSLKRPPEYIAAYMLERAINLVEFGITIGLDKALDKLKTPATATPPAITSEPHTLESEASKISDIYKF